MGLVDADVTPRPLANSSGNPHEDSAGKSPLSSRPGMPQ
jgi:hypothetical protein